MNKKHMIQKAFGTYKDMYSTSNVIVTIGFAVEDHVKGPFERLSLECDGLKLSVPYKDVLELVEKTRSIE